MSKSLSDMSGAELVAEYNRLAVAAGMKPVKRFADRASALKRINSFSNKESEMATKRKKNSKAKAKPAKSKEDKRSKIGIEFNVRAGTNREKLLETLHSNYRKQVTRRDLMRKIYGDTDDGNKVALSMVMAGLEGMIADGKLPYKVVKEKNEAKEITYGLFPK